MREMKDRIEEDLIKRVFSITVPETHWKSFYEKVDGFCKENYGDIRWIMLLNLIEQAEADWKYELLAAEISALKAKLYEVQEPQKGVDVAQKPTVPVFGAPKKDGYVGDGNE